MGPDHPEPGFAVHADRAGIGGIADHRDHLTIAACLALRDQPLQQSKADAQREVAVKEAEAAKARAEAEVQEAQQRANQ